MQWPESGRYRIAKERSLVTVFTYKVRNKLAAVAHDLELHTNDISGSVEVTGDKVEVDVTIGLWDLSVRDGILSRLEKAECERLMRKKVLGREGDAKARFVGSGEASGESATVKGRLTLLEGRTRDVSVECHLEPDGDGRHVVTLRQALLQTDYGIKPYTALMGALKLQDNIDIEIRATLASS